MEVLLPPDIFSGGFTEYIVLIVEVHETIRQY